MPSPSVLSFLRVWIRKALKRDRRWFLKSIAERTEVPAPNDPAVRVIFFAMDRGMLSGGGKVRPLDYYPRFSDVLHRANAEVRFVFSNAELRRSYAAGKPNVVICIYREDVVNFQDKATARALAPAAIVFNNPDVGATIGHKPTTNKALEDAGIPVPGIVSGSGTGRVVSNAVSGTNTEVDLIEAGTTVDPKRYNARFIDTTITWQGQDYLTSPRLLCVGPHIVSVFPRARLVSDGKASVKNRNTPVDADLLTHLFDVHGTRLRDRLERLAEETGELFGPSFICYDLLVETGTDVIYICEPNFKLNDEIYIDRFGPIAAEVVGDPVALSYTLQAEASARAFIACCADHGVHIGAAAPADGATAKRAGLATGGRETTPPVAAQTT